MLSSYAFTLLLCASSVVTGAVLPRYDLRSSHSSCKCIPGDQCWPSPDKWAHLNATVGGRLIATDQVANVCHGSRYNETACTVLKKTWDMPETHMFTAGEFDAPYFQNQSCDPYTLTSRPCVLGNYASYSINVAGAADVIAGLAFARDNNVRLVIKNSGHDYLGKSTGKGSLSLWTYNMKNHEFLPNFTSKAYVGPAMRIGAGMMGSEAYIAAHELGYRVVGGDCPTVGIAGGYTQGGGHSPLVGYNGMGADNVLQWEVVTPNGTHIVATPEQHSDLYWAMSGGGGGTWGVVISMVTKLHPDGPVGGASFSINSSSVSLDVMWAAVDAFHTKVPSIVDGGTTITYQITNTSFNFYAATAPNLTGEQVEALLGPYLSYLNQSNIPYTFKTTYFDTYYEHMNHYFGPFPLGYFPISQLTSGRLIPRATVTGNTTALGKAFRSVTQNGHFYLALFAFNAQRADPNVAGTNAVLPAWRDSIVHAIVVGPWDWTVPWSEMLDRQDEITNTIMPQLQDVTPGAGSYLNEADFQQPDWQQQFYGANYPRLLSIKRKYDPEDFFYAKTAVGSEAWVPDADDRLCRTHVW